MASTIRWSPSALRHLEAVCGYIGQDSEAYASIFAKDVMAIVDSLAAFPLSGRTVPEYGNPRIRERIYKNYRIVYRLRKGAVEIAAVCHGARLLRNVMREKTSGARS